MNNPLNKSLTEILNGVQITGDPAIVFLPTLTYNLERTAEEAKQRGLRIAGVPAGGLTIMPGLPLSDSDFLAVCEEYLRCVSDTERIEARKALYARAYPLFVSSAGGMAALYHPADYVGKLLQLCYHAAHTTDEEFAELSEVTPYFHISPVHEVVERLRRSRGIPGGAATVLPLSFQSCAEEAMERPRFPSSCPGVPPQGALFSPEALHSKAAVKRVGEEGEGEAEGEEKEGEGEGAAALTGTEVVDRARPIQTEYLLEKDFDVVSDSSVFYDGEGIDKRVVAVFIRNGVPQELCAEAASVLEPAATKHNRRAATNGGTPPDTGIVGYYDYLTNPSAHKCRETEFTRKNWGSISAPCERFLRAADEVYSRNAPLHHRLQKAAIPHSYQLFDTCFSSITVNRNFRTGVHTDKGDFKSGLGLLCVVNGVFSGCHLAIKKLKKAFKLSVGDVLLFDTSFEHGNTEVTSPDGSWYRTSVVCYLRTGLLSSVCERERRRKLNQLLLERLGAFSIGEVVDLNAAEPGMPPLYVPSRLVPQLSTTQQSALSFMTERAANNCGCVLALTMGLGKTLVSLTLCFSYQQRHPDRDILVVAPKPIIKHWIDESAKWKAFGLDLRNFVASDGLKGTDFNLRLLRYDEHLDNCRRRTEARRGFLFVINPEYMRSFVRRFKDFAPVILVVDEGHCVASRGNKLIQNLDGLGCPLRFVLSGTPLQNSAEELYQLVSWVNPSVSVVMPRQDFQRMSACINRYVTGADVAFLDAVDAQQYIHDWMSGHVFTDMDVDLPALHDYLLVCGSSSCQRSIEASEGFSTAHSASEHRPAHLNAHPTSYFAFISGLAVAPDKRVETVGLTAENMALVEECRRAVASGHLDSFIDMSGKLRVLVAIVCGAKRKNERVVIFSQYIGAQDLIHRVLTALGITCNTVRGRDAQDRRSQSMQAFSAAGGVDALLVSSRIGSHGLDFTAASHVVLFDSWWNPQADSQAIARVYRRNQKREVVVYRLLSGVETSILSAQKRKVALFSCIMKERTVREARADEISDFFDKERDLYRRQLWESLRSHRLQGGKEPALQHLFLYDEIVKETEEQ